MSKQISNHDFDDSTSTGAGAASGGEQDGQAPSGDASTLALGTIPAARDLNPSARVLAYALHDGGRMCQTELAEYTGLGKRTVRSALGELETANLVTTHQRPSDARVVDYDLDTANGGDA